MLAIMLSVLQISKDGMMSLSFFESGVLRWMQDSDLQYVHVDSGVIGNYKGDDGLDIETTNQKVMCLFFSHFMFSFYENLHVIKVSHFMSHVKGLELIWDPTIISIRFFVMSVRTNIKNNL